MRFDDMLATVIAADPASPALRRNRWRQIADIVAQKGGEIDRRIAARALAELARDRDRVPLADRIATAHALAAHARFAPLVAFFAHDVPDVARQMLARAQLDPGGWQAMIPALGPVGRAVLRGRKDLPAVAARALAALAPHDFRLGDAAADARARAAAEPIAVDREEGGANDQIRDLVRRIEAFREGREKIAASRADEPLGIASFRFATGPDGVVNWVEGAPRGPLIGLAIGEPAYDGLPGCDAAAAGAFRHRGEIRDARIVLPSLPGFAGSWRFSAIPQFDRGSGRFEGYRGTVRRAAPGEDARDHGIGVAVEGEQGGDALRQLVHELRTPLNAISGFAQIIAAEMMGPASDRYRGLAGKIAGDAGASLAMIDMLDLALAPRDEKTQAEPCDLVVEAQGVANELGAMLDERGVTLAIAAVGEAAFTRIAPGLARRMVLRLVSVLVQAAEPCARIDIAVAGSETPGEAGAARDDAAIVLGLPAPIADVDPADLRDPPAVDDDGPEAARLALAFALRLVDRAASGTGGRLLVTPGKLILRLPAHTRGARTGSGLA